MQNGIFFPVFSSQTSPKVNQTDPQVICTLNNIYFCSHMYIPFSQSIPQYIIGKETAMKLMNVHPQVSCVAFSPEHPVQKQTHQVLLSK